MSNKEICSSLRHKMKSLCIAAVVCAQIILASCWERTGASGDSNSGNPVRKEERELAASDPDKTAPSARTSESEVDSRKEESEAAPEPQDIGEDCVWFLRATKVVPPHSQNSVCPTCPANDLAVEVLRFKAFKIEKISSSESTCEVLVEISAEFNPSPGGTIGGGLTAWIPPEKREQYARGKTPAGPQIYKVKVIYRRMGGFWKAVEFDRADPT